MFSSLTHTNDTNPDDRLTHTLKFICWSLTTSAVMAVLASAQYLSKSSELNKWQLSWLDKTFIHWQIWSDFSWLSLPLVFTALICVWCYQFRWAAAITVIGLVTGAMIVAVDLYVFGSFGRHPSEFMIYLPQPRYWELGGGPIAHGLLISSHAALAACAIILTVVTTERIRRLRNRRASHIISLATLTLWVFILSAPFSIRQFAPSSGVWLTFRDMHAFDIGSWLAGSHTNPIASKDLSPNVRRVLRDIELWMNTPQPPDEVARLSATNQSPIVVFIVESWRHDVCQKPIMPKTASWSRQAWRFNKHYASSSLSELGLYSLLYGRNPLTYETDLSHNIAPQLCTTLRHSGYSCRYFTSHGPDWRGMEKFLNERWFDQVVNNDLGYWYQRDRDTVDQVLNAIRKNTTEPQFILAFLMASHFPYEYPADYRRYTPDSQHGHDRDRLWNRYRNALAFTDDLLAPVLKELSERDCIVVLTGDHGESFYDDGTLTHASRLSEISCRVPLMIRCPAAAAREFTYPTTHADLLPTLLHLITGEPVPLRNCYGRDLLEDHNREWAVQLAMPHSWQAWDLLTISNGKRFAIRLQPGNSQVLGFFDADGTPTPFVQASSEQIEQWSRFVLPGRTQRGIVSAK